MPDTPLPPPQNVTAREALAALPLEQPPHSAWPGVVAQLKRPRRRRHRPALWLAVAASAVLVAVWVPRLDSPTVAPPPISPTDAITRSPEAATGMDALVQRSQALEARIGSMPPALRSGGAVLAAEWIAADIGAIDVALADADPGDATMLWQARVALLAELAELRQSETIAATGSGALVLALD